MFEVVEKKSQEANIKVLGVGGCGGNAVDHMIEKNVMGVEFMCINTDLQALKKSQASSIIQIGEILTKGLGAGSRPDTGKQAAIDDREKIIQAMGRVGRNKIGDEYTIRLRDNSLVSKIFNFDENKPEVINMQKLFS